MITFTKRIIVTSGLVCATTYSVTFAQQNLVNNFSTIGTLVDAFTSSVIQSLGVLCMSAAVAAFFFGVAKYINGMRGGDATKVKDGNMFMVWGLVALFVMFSIWGIIYFAQGLFGIQGMNDVSKLFGGNIKAGTSYSTPLSPIGGGTNGSAVFPAGSGGVFQGGGAAGVGWTVGGAGGQNGFTVGGNGGTGGTGFGIGVGSNGVQSGGFMVNGVPAAQVPGVRSCGGLSAGAWCGSGMECALANDGSMSCFRSVDIKAGKAVPNAQASVAPGTTGGMSSVPPNVGRDCADNSECKGGAVCDTSNLNPVKPTYKCILNPVYKCSPGFECKTSGGLDGLCAQSGEYCEAYKNADGSTKCAPGYECNNGRGMCDNLGQCNLYSYNQPKNGEPGYKCEPKSGCDINSTQKGVCTLEGNACVEFQGGVTTTCKPDSECTVDTVNWAKGMCTHDGSLCIPNDSTGGTTDPAL